jgi:DNA polymerase III epsilon subunit-like protein
MLTDRRGIVLEWDGLETLFVVDLETTGLEPRDACVWSVGAVCICGGVITEQFSEPVQPHLRNFSRRHREVVQQVSGLGAEELLALLDARPAGDVRTDLLLWMLRTGQRLPAPVTSYNVAFDRKFLEGWPWYLGTYLEWQPCLMLAAQQQMGDALERRDNGTTRYPKLSAACEYFAVELTEAHSAIGDARAAAHLALRMAENTRVEL